MWQCGNAVMKYNDKYFTFLDQDWGDCLARVHAVHHDQADDQAEIHRPKK